MKLTTNSVRLYILYNVLTEFYVSHREDPFGIKDVICRKDLDDIVSAICTSTELPRHVTFLEHPIREKTKAMEGFGSCYITSEDFKCLEVHLLNRYFKTRKELFKINRICTIIDAVTLNDFIQQNLNYAQWYVECVLAKEVLTEVLSRKFRLPKDVVENECVSSEYSIKEFMKTEVKIAREAKQKMKTLQKEFDNN